MASSREMIQLNSTGLNQKGKPTGMFKVVRINKRLQQEKGGEKLEVKMFDRFAWDKDKSRRGMHVIFKQAKLKK